MLFDILLLATLVNKPLFYQNTQQKFNFNSNAIDVKAEIQDTL